MDEMTKGYVPIAVRDDHMGNTVVSFNTEERKFLLSVDGKLAGPFTLNELKALNENINDVVSMKGMYLFIKEYTARGEKSE